MKNERPRTQDLNLLSAYLDHALTDSEQQRLETRLAQEPALQERLDNLRKTKLMVGSLPRLKAPRDFTLTPEMVTVRRKRPQPLFPALKWATTIAAVLLVVLVSVELLPGVFMASRAAAPVAMMDSQTLASDPTPEPLIVWGAPDAGGLGGGTGGGTDGGDNLEAESFTMEEPQEEMETAPKETTEAVPETPVTESAPEEGIEEAAPADERAMDAAEEDQLILGLNTAEGGQIIEKSAPADEALAEPVPDPSPLRWAQIALAVIAVGGGVVLWTLRKKHT